MAYRLVGYFENWAQYRQAGGKFLPNQIDPFLFTHINFAFGIFGFVTRSVDPKNPRLTGDYTVQPVEWDDQSQLYPALQNLKTANPSLKTLLSIGGWSFNDPQDVNEIGTVTYQLFSQMASSQANRQEFIESALAYARKYDFDGIDIDWEYPGYVGRGGAAADLDNFLALAGELRAAAGAGFLLTMAAPAIVPTGLPAQYHQHPASYFGWVARCAQHFDWLNVMCYDYHGAFDAPTSGTGVNAPLLRDSTPNGPFSLSNTVAAYRAASIPPDRVVLGMPTYGRSYSGVSGLSASDNGPGKSFAGAGPAGPATGIAGVLGYYEIQQQIASGALTRAWDINTLTPYAYSGGGIWVSYDDTESLGYKASFLIDQGLGGAMIWSIDDDAFQGGSATSPTGQGRVRSASAADAATTFPLHRRVKGILDNPDSRPTLPSAGGIPAGSPNLVWSADTKFGPGTNQGPGLAVYDQLLYCVHRGGGTDPGHLYVTTYDGTSWSSDVLLPTAGGGGAGAFGAPALATFKGKLYCVHPGGGNAPSQLYITTYDGSAWGADVALQTTGGFGIQVSSLSGGVKYSSSPALAVYGDTLYCVYNGAAPAAGVLKFISTTDGAAWADSQTVAGSDGVAATMDDVDSPALAVCDDVLYCFHSGGTQSPGYLRFCSLAAGTTGTPAWSADVQIKTGAEQDGLVGGSSPSLAVYNNVLYCVHRGGAGDARYLWYFSLNFNPVAFFAPDQQLETGSDRATAGATATPGLIAYKDQLFCLHAGGAASDDATRLWETVSPPSAPPPITEVTWASVDGAYGYSFRQLDNTITTGRSVDTAARITVVAGTPFLYATLAAAPDTTDFPTGVSLRVKDPNGAVWNHEVHNDLLVVAMDGTSVRTFLTQNPMAGDWFFTLTAPSGVAFDVAAGTLPSQNVYDTIVAAHGAAVGSSRAQRRQLSGASFPLPYAYEIRTTQEVTGPSDITLYGVFRAFAAGLLVATATAAAGGLLVTLKLPAGDPRQPQEVGADLLNAGENVAIQDQADTLRAIGSTTSMEGDEQEHTEFNLITWNLQGANWSDPGFNPWRFVGNWFTQAAFDGLQLGVCCLQECGSPPGSAMLIGQNIGDIQGFSEYLWPVTLNHYVYVIYYPWDTGSGRVNLAVVSRTYYNAMQYFPGILRPLIGIKIKDTWYYSIHASANGGGDATPLVRQAEQNGPGAWIVAGDYNADPNVLAQRLRANGVTATICPPNGPTRPASGRQLDYAARDSASPVTTGQVMDVSTTGGLMRSDHTPVFFHLGNA
jgi:chitinase